MVVPVCYGQVAELPVAQREHSDIYDLSYLSLFSLTADGGHIQSDLVQTNPPEF